MSELDPDIEQAGATQLAEAYATQLEDLGEALRFVANSLDAVVAVARAQEPPDGVTLAVNALTILGIAERHIAPASSGSLLYAESVGVTNTRMGELLGIDRSNVGRRLKKLHDYYDKQETE